MDAPLPRTAKVLEWVRHLAISMLDAGQTPAEVADSLGVSERSVWRWRSAWASSGDAGLAARPGRGRPPKLTGEQTGRVLASIGRSPCEFGFATERWTAPRVAWLI